MEAFSELANRIADKVLQIIDKADPELVSDVTEEGILLSGGGSLIYGMEKLLAERTGLKISPSNEPLNVIAAGAGMAGEYISYIEEEKRQNDLDDWKVSINYVKYDNCEYILFMLLFRSSLCRRTSL